jgi:segregation and condensation protein A
MSADHEPEAALEPPTAPDPAPAAGGARRVAELLRAGSDDYWVEARGRFEEKDLTGYQPTPESEHLLVQLSHFEGPLDLLLYLIDRHALDIFDIPIARITEEYLKILDDMRALNLDLAGEFLVMAARLAHIKSKMLLPKEERDGDADNDDDGLDPRLELVKRLLEYARFRDAAKQLADRTWLGRDLFFRPASRPDVDLSIPDDPLGVGLYDFEVHELIATLEEVLRRGRKRVVHEVIAERLNVSARINELVDFARQREHFTFHDVLREFGDLTRRDVIVSFLAVLEMAKLKLLLVEQPTEGTIYIRPIMENLWVDDGPSTLSDFDEEAPAALGGPFV